MPCVASTLVSPCAHLTCSELSPFFPGYFRVVGGIHMRHRKAKRAMRRPACVSARIDLLREEIDLRTAVGGWKKLPMRQRCPQIQLARQNHVTLNRLRRALSAGPSALRKAEAQIIALERCVDVKTFETARAVHKSVKDAPISERTVSRARVPVKSRIIRQRTARKRANQRAAMATTAKEHEENLRNVTRYDNWVASQ